jgi:tetratricopeptide (TPR) repeat protein
MAAALGLAPASVAVAASPGQAAADRGAALYRSGDLVGAREAFREAVRLDPHHSNAWQSLGWVEYRLGNYGEARRIWEDLLRLEPGREDTREALAAVRRKRDRPESASPPEVQEPGTSARTRELFAQAERALGAGDPGAAERSLSELFALPGIDGQWTARAADLYLRHGAVERGIRFLDRPEIPDAPGKERGLSRLHAERATAAFRSGKFGDAAGSFARAVELDRENRLALRGLGWAYRREGRLDAAEEAWKRYARTFPALAEPHDLLAGLYLERRAYDLALTEARASLAIDPAPKGANVRYIRSLFGVGHIGEARRAAAALASRMPDDQQAQRLLADALTKSRSFGEAARQWRRVLDLDPESAVAKQNWVRSLYESGEADAAVREARTIAASRDAPANVLELLAEDGRARRDLDETARWYRELTRRFPDEVVYWRSLTQTLDALGRFREQVEVAREATAHLPDRSDLQLDLATALGNVGNVEEAIVLTRRHLQDHPSNRAAFQSLVDLLARSGDISGALELLSHNRPSFLKAYEQTMIEASLRARQRDYASATRLLRGLVESGSGARHFVPILLYHGIVSGPRTIQASTAAFDEQMAALESHGYHAITLRDLDRMIAGVEPFPERPILITFDDARADSFLLGDPILEKHGFRATMFVPTARIGVDDTFHAGWPTIARYAATGRWDVQAHGHEAHTPVTIDAAGGEGEFLAYRAYLPDRGRAETTPEFVARLERDYAACKGAIEQHLPEAHVIGYAYPLNQVTYAQREDGAALSDVNERLAGRYFQFGMVQDESGYNGLRAGEPAPFMLRRFEVPGDWSGRELLAHLARNEPVRAARLALERLEVDEGRPAAARRRVADIVREEPLVAPEGEAVLAQAAWEEDRPREAAVHLAASPPPKSPPDRVDTLANKLAWRNQTVLGGETTVFSESDGRAEAYAGAEFRRPLADQLDLDVGAGQVRLAERGFSALTGPQFRAQVSGALGHTLGATSWLRYRQLQVHTPLNGGLTLQLRNEQHSLSLQALYEDVDTVQAVTKSIQQQFYSAAYAFRSPNQRIDASVGRFQYDDGNTRNDLHAIYLHLFGDTSEWGVGGSVDLENSRFAPREYYAPQGLVVGLGRLRYLRTWSDSTSLTFNAGAGVARDTPHGERASGEAGISLSRWWGAHQSISTELGIEGRVVPGYQSLGAMFRLGFRL